METALLVVVILLLGLLLLSHWVTFFQVVRQQGWMLLRLEGLEQSLGEAVRLKEEDAPALPVGASFPLFDLPDLDGNRVSLAQFRGQQVLLVHWSPACGFCNLIGPDLAELHPELEKRKVALLLISREEAAANRKLAETHSLRCPVLLQGTADFPAPLRGLGTPVAYLLDEAGRVAAPLAEGADEVLPLARQAARGGGRGKLPGSRPLSESAIERNGLRAGSPAPEFRLPDLLTGQEISLESFRGREVLLVFTDPHCGSCNDLVPHLNRLHDEGAPDLVLIVVGRGDPEENRRKAEEHHARYPLVLQRHWELSRKYGIFATPVAFLIDRDGVIARDVTQGVPEILALASEVTARQLQAVPG